MDNSRTSFRRAVSLAACASLVALPGLALQAPTHAAPNSPAKVRVTAGVTDATPAAGARIRVRGEVSGRSVGARVILQRKVDAGWRTVKRARVSEAKRYVVRIKARPGRSVYRVKVVRNARVATSYSPRVVVRGKRSTAGVSAAVRRVLADTNAFRAEQGMAPLKLHSAMSRVAHNWSVTMGRTGDFKHNPNYAEQIPGGWSRVAENIAAGYSLNTVVDGWINSPGHRANMLGDYTHIGIGVAEVAGSRYGTYYTQVFAKY